MVKSAATRTDGSAVLADDNSKAMVEAEKTQLISYVGKINQAQKAAAVIKAKYDEARGVVNDLFAGAKQAHFQRKEIQSLLDDMNSTSRNIVDAEQRRRRFREYMGLPNGETTMDLFGDESPAEVRDESHWRAEGVMAGLRGDVAKAPDNCPPRFVPAFTEGWHGGAMTIAGKMAKPDKKPKPAAVEPVAVNRAEAAGWKVFELEGEPPVFELENPEGVALSGEYPTREEAWLAAEAFMDAPEHPAAEEAERVDSEVIH